jgi:uncharacterized protein (TIGR03437 family)
LECRGLPDSAFTPNTLINANVSPIPATGAYFGAADFSQPAPPAGTPQIACIVDSADSAPVGLAARYQLLTIYGTGLGLATGVGATDLTYSLGGDAVSFIARGNYSAPLLYASSTQINLAVPLVATTESSAALQVAVNGVVSPMRSVPFYYANPSLFLDSAETYPASGISPGFVAVALNADGSVNSPANPAQLGSTVSVFVNGLTPDPQVTNSPLHSIRTTDGP